nr:reverse transcriptase domain-containing protein [Tanacetum cinerariifolium]
MSTRSSIRDLFPPLDNPELTIRRRSRVGPTLLNDFEMATKGNDDPPVLDLRTMEEFIKVNGVTDDALRLYPFPHSLTHHATAWFDRLLRNSINTFEQMAKMFLGKYFPPSMVTNLRNEITNFRRRPDESLFEAWERCKLSIDCCPNHNMLPITQIDTFYNGLTLRHRDTINVAAGETFMKRHHEELTNKSKQLLLAVKLVVVLILTIIVHPPLAKPRTYMLKEPIKVVTLTNLKMAIRVKAWSSNRIRGFGHVGEGQRHMGRSGKGLRRPEECYDLIENMTAHHNDWDTSAQRSESSSSITFSSDPEIIALKAEMAEINKNLMKFFRLTNKSKQLLITVKLVVVLILTMIVQPPLAKPRTYMLRKPIIKVTNMTSLKNSNLKLKNMFGQFMKMNTTSSSGLRTLPSNTITNSKEDLKGITTRSGNAYQGPTIPTTSSSPPKVVERETEVTKDMVPPTNNGSTKDVQPLFVQVETTIPNSEPIVAPVIEPVVSPIKRDLIDVYEGELTLRVSKEAVTFNLDQTSRYSTNYDVMSVNRIYLINVACEEYSQEVLGLSVEAKALPTNDSRVVCKFLKSLFARFGTPHAIISDRGTHFCNDQFVKVLLKYGVTHRLAIAYHPQTSGQVEVSNRGLKRILERTIGENHAS